MFHRVLLSAILLSAAGGAVVRRPAHMPSFAAFIQRYERTYTNSTAEYNTRRAVYEERLFIAEQQNAQDGRTWNAGVNKFSDWTEPELRTMRGWDGSVRPAGGVSGRGSRAHSTHTQAAFLQRENELPKEKIWSNLAMSNRVMDQASCGSCWAVATASVLEGHYEIHTGKHRTFSVQQIVSCTPNPRHCGGAGGCQGATAELAMDWILHHGCANENQVPYNAADDKCTEGSPSLDMAQLFSNVDAAAGPEGGLPAAKAFGMTGWETLPKNQYEPLARALAERGPVAVSVAASDWFNYEDGIFNGCGKDAIIDHAVTAIGYGEQDGHPYWVIQNSWGGDWGESGHIRMERHASDTYCGMNKDPQKGVACEGENAPVPVCGMCGVLFDSVVPNFS
jgi:cathepsin L